MPVYLETGHSVILGTNPLVRSFDAVPVTVNAAYEYFPLKYLSLGAFAGAGLYAVQVQHYPVVLDLLTNKLKTTRGTEGAFTAGVSIGSAILDRSVEWKASFSVDILVEKSRAVPLPSFQVSMRVYPGAVYAYARKKWTAEYKGQECAKTIETLKTSLETERKAALAVEQAPKVPERKEEAEKPTEKPLEQFKSIYVYFEPESTALDVNAKADIKKAAAILKGHEDIFVLFESSVAPFGSQDGRLQIETARVRAVSDYLKQKCDITNDRMIYNEPKDKNYQRDTRDGEDDYYMQYRYVKIRFVRIHGDPEEEENIYRRD